MSILATKILYIAVMALSVGCMCLSCKKKRHINIWTVLATLLLGLLVGFRGETVGIDTATYTSAFETLKLGYQPMIHGIDEIGFLGISYILVQFTSVQFVFVFWALLTNFLIMIRLHELKDTVSIPVAMLAFFSTFFFVEFNVMRELVALAVVFYATRWLERKKYVKFGISCIVAMSFHLSAIVAVAIIPAFILMGWKWSTSKQKENIVGAIILAIIPATVLILKFLDIYSGYLTIDLTSSGIGFLMPLKIVCFFVIILFVKNIDRDCLLSESNKFCKKASLVYFVGLLFYFASYFIKYMDRVAYYYFIMELVCLGYWYIRANRNFLVRWIIIFIAAVPLVLMLISNGSGGQGQFPYYFFWQNIK